MRLIDADNLREGIACHKQYTDQEYETDRQWALGYNAGIERALFSIAYAHTIAAEPVRHGRWILKAHNERVNYRWNVTAECSECRDVKTEIWAGFFPGIPDYLAEGAALSNAKQVKLSNYCPNCGAKMDGGAEDDNP